MATLWGRRESTMAERLKPRPLWNAFYTSSAHSGIRMGPVLFPQVADVFVLQRGGDRTFPNDVARRIELQETLAGRAVGKMSDLCSQRTLPNDPLEWMDLMETETKTTLVQIKTISLNTVDAFTVVLLHLLNLNFEFPCVLGQ